MNSPAADIDTYLAGVREDFRPALEALRRTIRDVAPDAIESMSYGMPTFKYRGRPLAYFAAAKNHCALYGFNVEAHRDALAGFKGSKGTIRFTPDEPIPAALVRSLVAERKAAIDAAAATRGARAAGTT